jgi:transcription initiation factor IIE alpha subunit
MKKLVIKAANGSVEDFEIDAELNWSVKEVKGHIYRLYPTHPVSFRLIVLRRIFMW